jgi:Bacterial PH domain
VDGAPLDKLALPGPEVEQAGTLLPPVGGDNASVSALSQPLASPQEEVDVWYGAYAGRTMLPQFLLAALLSAVLFVLARLLGAWHGSPVARYLGLALALAIWAFVLTCWLYRMTAINYRLTTRRLFIERGFGHPGRPGVELSQVDRIDVEFSYLGQKLDVGRLRITLKNDKTGPLILEGVHHPHQVVERIRKYL